jgi:hypothetical protein
MRVAARRPGPADAGSGDGVLGAATSAMMKNVDFVDFGEYLGGPSVVRCDPGGATTRRRRASG